MQGEAPDKSPLISEEAIHHPGVQKEKKISKIPLVLKLHLSFHWGKKYIKKSRMNENFKPVPVRYAQVAGTIFNAQAAQVIRFERPNRD